MLRAAHSKQTIPLRRGTWSDEEDQKLTGFIHTYGILNWNNLPKAAGLLRTGKSCRLRWVNYLKPDLKHGNFSKEEVETILKMQEDIGNRWSTIAAKLPGRTDNEIKNFWNAHLKKRLNKRQKIDGVQATEVQKQENVSKDNVSSFNDSKSPFSKGLEETPKSQEVNTPVTNFSSDSNSLPELDEARIKVGNIASGEFLGELEGLRKETPKSPEVYTPLINVASDSNSVPWLDETHTMEENMASDEFPEELEDLTTETPKSHEVYTSVINLSSKSNSVPELVESLTEEKSNASREFPGELEGLAKETPKSPEVNTQVINFSSNSNSIPKLDEAQTVEESKVSEDFPAEPKCLPKNTPKSPEVCCPVIHCSSDSNSFSKLDESHTKEENSAFQESPGELQGLPKEPLAMESMQILCDGKISGKDWDSFASSSSSSLNELDKNQSTEKNSNSPGLFEELQTISDLPFLADDFQERITEQLLLDEDFWANTYM